MSLNGVLLINKPEGLTSHDVVEQARNILKIRRVGHTGTLDPMATGLLPLCVGKATRLSQFLTSSDKTYVGTLRFGVATDTHDREGRALSAPRPITHTEEEVRRQVAVLTGPITQIPPIYSAKKHGGVPLYRFARRQQDVPRKPVQVVVHHWRILALRREEMDFEVKSSQGTYVRVLAHDLGEALGCGAHLFNLERTVCGEFSLDDAIRLDRLERIKGENRLEEVLIPMERVPLGFGTVVANRLGVQAVRNGRTLGVREILPSRSCLELGPCRVESETGELLAIGRVAPLEQSRVSVVHPQIVFPPE